MRPMSAPARVSTRDSRSGGIQRGCSITKRYMSTTHTAPSGPVRTCTGRNQLSADARNSRAASPSAPCPSNVAPEPVAEIVAPAPELRPPRRRLERQRVGVHAEVAVAQLHHRVRARDVDRVVADRPRPVHPVVQPPGQPVHLPLLILRRKTAE